MSILRALMSVNQSMRVNKRTLPRLQVRTPVLSLGGPPPAWGREAGGPRRLEKDSQKRGP